MSHRFFRTAARTFLPAAIFLGIACLSLLNPRPVCGEENSPHIVILNSYHQGYAWSDHEIAGILSGLRRTYPNLEPPVEHMDAKRFPGEDQVRRFRTYLQDKYRNVPVDLVMALDNSALELALAYGSEIFPNTPIVFAGVNGFHPRMLQGHPNVTGISERQDILGAIRLGLRLHPGATEILAIHDYTNTGLALRRETEKIIPELPVQVRVTFTPRVPFQELLDQLAALPPKDLGIILTYGVDSEGYSPPLSESTKLFSSFCPAPLFATNETRLGHGIVGGMLISGEEQGQRAADIALRVLSGTSPSDIPVVEGVSRPMFDQEQLDRFRMDSDLMPANSTVVNRPSSFWVLHKEWVLLLSGIVGLLILTVIVLSVSVARIKKAEQRALKSREQFRQVTETIREVFWLAAPDWKAVYYVSPAYDQVWGRPGKELLRNPLAWYASVVQEDRPGLRDAMRDRNRIWADEPTLPDFRIRRPDGSIAWISARAFPVLNGTGNPERIAGIAEDITEFKRDEEAIQTIMEATAGSTGQALYSKIVDRISRWLDCEVALIGEIQPNRHVKTLAMVVDGEPVDEFEYDLKGTPCEHATQGGFCHHPVEIAELYPEDLVLGEMGAVGYVGVPVKDQLGSAIGVLCAISRHELRIPPNAEQLMKVIAARAAVEIQRNRIETEKGRLESQLIQSQKMEAIGTLAGGIAHDFNNILFPILGYAEMLQDDLPPESPSQAGLREIIAGAKRARDLVKQILAFGRQASQEVKPIRVQSLLKEVIKLTRSTLPTTIEIRQEIDAGQGMILADPTHIHQIAMNLITNAYHAMENGGVLTIRLNEAEISPENPSDSELEPGPYLRLSVEDTGIGMDAATKEKIFDPYFTTKEKDKGTGLGLSVVHGIIQNYGGRVSVQSTPGRGSVFEVLIPRIPDQSEGKHLFETGPPPKGDERILLVEDEESIARMEKQMLERLGYRVSIRTSGTEALAAFRGNPDGYDLVITDMTMPGMTGDRLATEIFRIRRDAAIILCTGFSERMSAEKAAALGIGGFIMKPVVQSELALLIRNILDKN